MITIYIYKALWTKIMPILNRTISPFGFVLDKNYFSRMNQENAMEKWDRCFY